MIIAINVFIGDLSFAPPSLSFLGFVYGLHQTGMVQTAVLTGKLLQEAFLSHPSSH